jgi:hypothetical protein
MLTTMFDFLVGDVKFDRTSSKLKSLLLAYAAQAVLNSLHLSEKRIRCMSCVPKRLRKVDKL